MLDSISQQIDIVMEKDSSEELRPFLPETLPGVKVAKSRIRSHADSSHGARSITTQILSHTTVAVVVSGLWLIALFALSTRRTALSPATEHTGTSDPAFLAHEVEFLTCGSSLEEAKLRGCKYDILTNHWLPYQCADRDSILDYQADGSWTPFMDEQRSNQLEVEQLGDLPFYYTSLRDHIVHCASLWRRQYRAFAQGWKYIDEITADEAHTMHCAQFLMDKAEIPAYRNQAIKVEVGKSGCHVRESGLIKHERGGNHHRATVGHGMTHTISS